MRFRQPKNSEPNFSAQVTTRYFGYLAVRQCFRFNYFIIGG
jgi:hypothetical protein